MSKRFDRTIALMGSDRFNRLACAHVLIVGLGGVGGSAAETLVRYGVGEFTFVDGDTFEESNLNRQLLATTQTLGRNKAQVAAERARLINPDVKTNIFKAYYADATSEEIFAKKYDFCVDAIDDVENKVHLIVKCKELDIPVICATGAGNRLDCNFKIADINSTSHDWLARTVRKKLRDRGIKEVPAVCAAGPAQRPDDVDRGSGFIPSCASPPLVMGAMMASYVVNRLIGL